MHSFNFSKHGQAFVFLYFVFLMLKVEEGYVYLSWILLKNSEISKFWPLRSLIRTLRILFVLEFYSRLGGWPFFFFLYSDCLCLEAITNITESPVDAYAHQFKHKLMHFLALQKLIVWDIHSFNMHWNPPGTSDMRDAGVNI